MQSPKAIIFYTLTSGPSTYLIRLIIIHSMLSLCLCFNWLVLSICCQNGRNCNFVCSYVNQIIPADKGKGFLIRPSECVFKVHSFVYIILYEIFFACIILYKKSNFSVNSTSSFDRPAEYKLRQLLKELRISATIHQIPEWTESEEFAENGSVLKFFSEDQDGSQDGISEEDINRSKLYMQG